MKKRIISLLLVILLACSYITVNAAEDDVTVPTVTEDECIDILIIGNSLVSYNDMCKVILPKMFESAGKNVKIKSITKSETSMYDFVNEETSVGERTLNALKENVYDYVIVEPSRQVTPFEYSVYHAEKAAVQKLNELANNMGAKTLILAEPGINLGKIRVHSMNEDGTDAVKKEWLPIDRNTHSVFFENLCEDFCQDMINAEVVKIGNATELIIKNLPNYGSFYVEDERHPSIRGSYLQALCIYSAIFGEDYVGNKYTGTLTKYNALIAQRAVAVAMFDEPEEILLTNEAERTVKATLIDSNTATIKWNEPLQNVVEGYNIYRKTNSGKYNLLTTISSDGSKSGEYEYIDTTLEPESKYSYKIKAIQTVGDLTFLTSYSSASTVETLPLPKIQLTTTAKGKIKVKITKVKGANGYEIQLSKGNKKNYHTVGNTSKLSYTATKLTSKKTYYVKIRAYNKGKNNCITKLSEYAVAKIKVK